MKIFVADPDSVSTFLTIKNTPYCPHDITIFYSGMDLANCAKEEEPDMIFIDSRMSDQVNLSTFISRTVITSNRLTERLKENYLASGFAEVLQKPYTHKNVEQLLFKKAVAV